MKNQIDENKYLGTLCKYGHKHETTNKSIRYIKSKRCVVCYRLFFKRNRDKRLLQRKEYRLKNKIIINKYNAKYRAKHKTATKEYGKKYRQLNKKKIDLKRKKNKDRINEIQRNRYNEKLKNNINYKINRTMRRGIWKSLKNNKNGCHWERFINFSFKELKKHLEKQFTDGMNWDNYGEWHIDHIIPISAFNFNSYEDIEFKRCWDLSNLQPLWAKNNISKSYHFIQKR